VIAVLDGGDTSTAAITIGWAPLFSALRALLGLGIPMALHNSTGRSPARLELVIRHLVRLFFADEIARFLPASPDRGRQGAGAESLDADEQGACWIPAEGGQFRRRHVRGDLFAYSDGSCAHERPLATGTA
jgi:hypothetical protein